MAESNTLIVDLSNYRDRVGARVTPGRYRVQVEDVENTKASSGNPMINVWLRIVGGDFDGQTVVDRLVITEKSLFRVVGFMGAIGLPTPKQRLKVNTAQWVGKVLDVDIEDGDPYNGRVKSEVRGYMKVAKKSSAPAAETADLEDLEEVETVTPVEDAVEAATPVADDEVEQASHEAQSADAAGDDEDEGVDLESLRL